MNPMMPQQPQQPNQPSQVGQPGILDNLMNYIFNQVNTAKSIGHGMLGGVVPRMMQQGNSPIFSDPSQNNTQMQGIVNAYMKQKQATDAAAAAKKKKKPAQPTLEEDD